MSHRYLGKQALKAFRPKNDLPSLEDLLGEARTLVDLTHTNVVRVYDANIGDVAGVQFPFITMEWCPGGTFADELKDRTRLPLATVLEVGKQICAALAYTHGLDPPLLHLDIKPANVLVFKAGEHPQVKVGDYGLAQRLDPLTRLSRSAGTLAFAPPEMSWGVADERSDVYSAGVTLYRALTGFHPFPLLSREAVSATTEFRKALVVGRRDIAPPSKMLMHDVGEIDAILLRAMAFDPFDRYKNAQEFGEALAGVS